MTFFKRYSRHSDSELVSMVSGGDDQAFSELLRRYQDTVYGFAFRMLQDAQEAEDVVQETFLRLYKISGSYRPDAALKTFLLRIAKNLCIDYFRKKRPQLLDELPEAATGDTPLNLLQTAIETDRLEKAIDRLPSNQRAAILLRHTENMPYRQIASTMDLSEKAVESLLVRARRNLHGLLA